MTRHIVLDTETTGLSPKDGDRIIQLAAVEMINYRLTGNNYCSLFNPQGRRISDTARQIHQISDDMVANAPLFGDKVHEIEEFIGDSPLIIHNAEFDMGMLEAEYALINRTLPENRVIDTLVLARKKFSGQVSLDALCKRFGIDLSVRDRHDALIDCELLAQVYRKMFEQVELDILAPQPVEDTPAGPQVKPFHGIPIIPALVDKKDLDRHQALLASMGEQLAAANKDLPIEGQIPLLWTK